MSAATYVSEGPDDQVTVMVAPDADDGGAWTLEIAAAAAASARTAALYQDRITIS